MFKRKFISVGHGGFSKETFYNDEEKPAFSIVYDCGSYRPKEIEEKIDKNTLPDKKEVINILFLSHFDNDHINGVERLLDRCQVQKLMMPLYNTSVLLAEYVLSTTRGSSFSSTPTSRIIASAIYRSSVGNTETVYVPVHGDNAAFGSRMHKSGNTIDSPLKEIWEYIPYNIPFDDSQHEAFYNWLIARFPKCLNEFGLDIGYLDDLLLSQDIFSEVKNKLKKFKDKNEHSMILYSGPVELVNGKTEERAPCLYMGDFDATKKNISTLVSLLAHRWPFIHLLQVPHHGSKYNYHAGTHLYDNQVVGITFASESEEKYPAAEIKNEIVENQGIPIKVSYSEYTEVNIVIKNY